MQISIAGPEDTNGIREVQYKSWFANAVNEESGRSGYGANKRRSSSSRDATLSKENDTRSKDDGQSSRRNSLPKTETFVAKLNQKVIGFCTVVRGSEQNSLTEIYVIPAFQGKKIGRRLWNSARRVIDQNNDTTVALLRSNTPAKKFYESLGFTETGISWEGEDLKREKGTTVIEMILRA